MFRFTSSMGPDSALAKVPSFAAAFPLSTGIDTLNSIRVNLGACRIARSLVRKWNRDRDAVFIPEVSRNVTLPRRIFDQVDMAGTDRHFLPPGNLDLSSTGERDYE